MQQSLLSRHPPRCGFLDLTALVRVLTASDCRDQLGFLQMPIQSGTLRHPEKTLGSASALAFQVAVEVLVGTNAKPGARRFIP